MYGGDTNRSSAGWVGQRHSQQAPSKVPTELAQARPPACKVLRIDGKVSSFNYACQKELKDGAEAVHYSQAKAFWAFMCEVHPGVPALDTGRGKCGSRFDAEVEIAFTMYYLRPFIIEFVAKRIVGALDSSGGKLMEGAIFAHGTILEIVAAQRARAVVYDKLIEPLRCGCRERTVV